MANEYPTKTAGEEFLSGLSPYLGSAEQFQGMGGGMLINMLMGLMGVNPQMNPGRHFMNQADNQFQKAGLNAVRMSSLMATNDLSSNSTLMQVLRGSTGDLAHGRQGFMQQYSQAVTNAGVMAPFYQSSIMTPQTRQYIRGMGGDLDAVAGRTRARGRNITSFFNDLADEYGKDNTAFGGGNLADIGQVGAEVVRTAPSMFGGDPEQFKEKAEKLKNDIKDFTSAAESLKGVLGGDAMHALDVMNDAFGVNVTATFRDNGSLLERQATAITHTARLTGTSASNIMRLSGVAGAQMEAAGGSRLGSMMVGTMAAQAGQAGDLAFINESRFRSMQTTRLAGAATSETAKRVSGAYALWREKEGADYKTEEAAYAAFNIALRKEAGDDEARMGDVGVLSKVSGASAYDMASASSLDRARLYRSSDTTATEIAKSRQIKNTRGFRTAAITEMLKEEGVTLTAAEIEEYEQGDSAARRKLLKGKAKAGTRGRIKDVLDEYSAAFGYGDDASFRGAVRADERADEIRVQVAARQGLEKQLGIKGVGGVRGILDIYDKLAEAPADMTAEQRKEWEAKNITFDTIVATALGVDTTSEEAKKLGAAGGFSMKKGIFEDAAGKIRSGVAGAEGEQRMLEEGGVRSAVTEIMTTLESGTLSEEDQKALKTNMRAYMEEGDITAFQKAVDVGTKEGYRGKLMEEYGVGITKGTDADRTRKAILTKIAEERGFQDDETLEAAILSKGLDSDLVKSKLLGTKEDMEQYTRETSRAGVQAASDPISRILALLEKIWLDYSGKAQKENTSNSKADEAPKTEGSH